MEHQPSEVSKAFPSHSEARRSMVDHLHNVVQKALNHEASRRDAMRVLVGASASIPLWGPLARAATAFSLASDEKSARFLLNGIPLFLLRTDLFDGSPTLSVRSGDESFAIHLVGALFPGSNLPADLTVAGTRTSLGWEARLRMASMRFDASFSFEQWLVGQPVARSPIRIPGGLATQQGMEVSVSDGTEAVFYPDWTFKVAGAGAVRVSSPIGSIAGEEAQLEVIAPEEAPILLKGNARPQTRIWIVGQTRSLAQVDIGEVKARLADGKVSVLVEFQRAGDGDIHSASSIETIGQGVPAGQITVGAAEDATVIQANKMCVTQSGQCKEQRFAVVAALTQNCAWVSKGRIQAELVLQNGEPFRIEKQTGCECIVPQGVVVTRIVAPLGGVDQAMFVRRGLSVVAGRYRIEQRVSDQELDGIKWLTDFSIGTPKIPLRALDLVLRRGRDGLFVTVRFKDIYLDSAWSNLFLIGTGSDPLIEFDLGPQHVQEEALYVTDLAKCQQSLNVSAPECPEPSPDDLIRLSAEELYYWFVKMAEDNYPWPREFRKPREVPLPPEDFIEEIKRISCERFKQIKKEAVKRYLAQQSRECTISEPCLQAKSRFAKPTWLTFKLAGSDRQIPFDVDALFHWSFCSNEVKAQSKGYLECVLSQLALGKYTKLGDQWALRKQVGLRPRSLAESPSLIPAPGECPNQGNPPEQLKTEFASLIHAPYRLGLSPIDKMLWRIPPVKRGTSLSRAELWHVKAEQIQLRAIWSPDFTPENFFASNFRHWPGNQGGGANFRGAIDARDRHEIVALTTGFGRRAKRGSDQVVPDPDEIENSEKGIYVPKPIDAKFLILTSLGATLDLSGVWAPPSSPSASRSLSECKPGALTVERWDHRSQIGRDTKVVVEYKGFLFPLGHPCTLVKETERRLVTAKRKGKDCVVARLVQRFFIKVPSFVRAFSVQGQPFQGRAWPFSRVTTEKFVSLDLAKPETSEIIKGLGQQAFWPRLATDCSKYVEFPFHDEATGVRMSAPLIFIDNEIVHNPKSLLDVIRCYRSRVEKSRNDLAAPISNRADWKSVLVNSEKERIPTRCIVRVHGGTIAYAESNGVGDTKYQTRRFLLDVDVSQPKCTQSSLRTQDSCNEEACGDSGETILPIDEEKAGSIQSTLVMSAAMEAASQPAFFPHLRQALIEPGQLALLSGQQHGENVVEFDAGYLRHGFASSQNAGEIMLRFVDGGVRLNFSNNTAASGGVGNPSTQIVAISRKRGPIGGDGRGCVPQGESYRYQLSERILTLNANPLNGDTVTIDGKRYVFQSALTDIDGHVLIGKAAEETAANLVDAINCKVKPSLPYADATVPHPTCCAELRSQPPRVVVRTIVGNLQEQGVNAEFTDKQANIWSGADPMLVTASAAENEFIDPCAAARQDMMKPVEFFAQVLGDAKLLGCVRFVDILAVALQASGSTMPRILDRLIPGISSGDIQDIVQGVRRLLSVESEIGKAVGNFPYLRPAVIRLDKSLEALSRASSSGEELSLAEGIAVVEAAKAFEKSFRAAIDDPRLLLPPETRTLLESFRDLRAEIENTFRPEYFQKLGSEIRSELIAIALRQLRRIEELVITRAQKVKTQVFASSQLSLLTRYIRAEIGELKQLEEETKSNTEQFLRHVGSRVQGILRNMEELANLNECLKREQPELCTAFERFVGQLTNLELQGWVTNFMQERGTDLLKEISSSRKTIEAAKDQLRDDEASVRVKQRLNDISVELSKVALSIQARIGSIQEARETINKDLKELLRACSSDPNVVSEAMASQLRRGAAYLDEVLALFLDMVRSIPAIDDATRTIQLDENVHSFSLINPDSAVTATTSLQRVRASYSKVLQEYASKISPAVAELMRFTEKCNSSSDQMIVCKVGRWITPHVAEASRLLAQVELGTDLEKLAAAVNYSSSLQQIASIVFASFTFEGAIRKEFQNAVTDIQGHLKSKLLEQAKLITAQLAVLAVQFDNAAKVLRQESVKKWISDPLRNRIEDVARSVGAVKRGPSQDGSDLAAYFSAVQIIGEQLEGLVRELNQIVSSGDIGALINAKTFVDQVMAALAFPMKARLTYDWNTEVHSYPGGAESIFEPMQDKESRLTINAVVEAAVGEGAAPTSSVTGTLDPFKINLLGCLSIEFSKLTFTAGSGKKPHCEVSVQDVGFLGHLSFIQTLQEWFKKKTGLLIDPWSDGPGVVVTYAFNEDVVTIPDPNPTFVMQNVGFSISCVLPFNDEPARFRFALASAQKPFLLSVGIYGGGGFAAIQTRADTIELLEFSFEYGLVTAFKFGPAVGTGRITAGIYIRLKEKESSIEGFFNASGNADIAGLVTVDAVFRVGVRYAPVTGQVWGRAYFAISFEVGFLEYDYDVEVAYARNGTAVKETQKSTMVGSDPSKAARLFTDVEPSSKDVPDEYVDKNVDHAKCLLKADVWKAYWSAFEEAIDA